MAKEKSLPFQLDKENRNTGTVSWEKAYLDADHGTPFVIELKDRWYAIDLDSRDQAHLDLTLDFIKILNPYLNPVVINSGRNYHIFFYSEKAFDKGAISVFQMMLRRVNGAELRRKIRAPLSPHRLGLPVSIANCSFEDAVTFLSTRDRQKQDKVGHGIASQRCKDWNYERSLTRVNPQILNTIFDGVERGQRSENCMKAICALVNSGFNDSQIKSIMLDENHGISDRYTEKGESVLCKEIKKARAYIANNSNAKWMAPPSDHSKKLAIWHKRLKQTPVSGRELTERDLLLTMIKLSYILNKESFHLSLWDTYNLTGISINCAAQKFKALRAKGLIELVKAGTRTEGAIYRLLIPNEIEEFISQNPSVLGLEASLLELAMGKEGLADVEVENAVFRSSPKDKACLGRSTRVVLEHLKARGEVGATVKALMSSTGLSSYAIRRRLNQCLRRGFVVRDGVSVWKFKAFDVSEYFFSSGLNGVHERRKQMVQNHRENYRLARINLRKLQDNPGRSYALGLPKIFTPRLAEAEVRC